MSLWNLLPVSYPTISLAATCRRSKRTRAADAVVYPDTGGQSVELKDQWALALVRYRDSRKVDVQAARSISSNNGEEIENW